MSPLLGAGDFLSWSRRHPPAEPQPGDDRAEAEPQVDVSALGALEPPAGASQDYRDGWADVAAGKGPDINRMALGANRLNDYERGYIDGGKAKRHA